MAVNNDREEHDFDTDWECRQEMAQLRMQAWEEEEAERRQCQIRVRFRIEGGKVKGRVIQDSRNRTKIVFPVYNWQGDQPRHGEEIDVRIVRETWVDDPRRGVLFVERDPEKR